MSASVIEEGDLSPAEEARMMREAIFDGMPEAELVNRGRRLREDLIPIDTRICKFAGNKVISVLAELGVVNKDKCGEPKVKIDERGRISVSGSLGKFREDSEILPLAEFKAALGIQLVNFETGSTSFLVEFSLADYERAITRKENIEDPAVSVVVQDVQEGTEGIVG